MSGFFLSRVRRNPPDVILSYNNRTRPPQRPCRGSKNRTVIYGSFHDADPDGFRVRRGFLLLRTFRFGGLPFSRIAALSSGLLPRAGGFRARSHTPIDYYDAAPAWQKRRCYDFAACLFARSRSRLSCRHRFLFGAVGFEVQPPCAADSRIARIRGDFPGDDHQARFQAAELHPHGR